MARKFAALFLAVMLFVAANANSSCDSVDIVIAFSAASMSNQRTLATNVASLVLGNFGSNVRISFAFGTTASGQWYTSPAAFSTAIASVTAPVVSTGTLGAIKGFFYDEDAPSTANRKVIVVFLPDTPSTTEQASLVAFAKQLKTDPSIEIFTVGTTDAAWRDDLASPESVLDISVTSSSSDEAVAQAIFGFPGRGVCYLLGGHPRIGTFDGKEYNYPGYGEFVFFQTDSISTYIQLDNCLSPAAPSSTTCLRGVAIVNGPIGNGNALEFLFEPAQNLLHVLTGGSVQSRYPFGSGGYNSYNGVNYRVEQASFPGSSELIYQIHAYTSSDEFFISFGPNLPGQIEVRKSIGFGRTRGLCGTWDGCTANDWFSRDQVFLPADASAEDVYSKFGHSWRAPIQEYSFQRQTDASYYAWPQIDTYSPNWGPRATIQITQEGTAECSYFEGKSNYFAYVCAQSVSNGYPLVKQVLAHHLVTMCKDHCLNGEPLNHFIDEDWCQDQCRVDWSQIYDNILDDDEEDIGLNLVDVKGSEWGYNVILPFGGRYTYELKSSYCDISRTGVINIQCDASPSVNAGADRIVSRGPYGFPRVNFAGSVSDVNPNKLQYYWRPVVWPVENATANTDSYKRQAGYPIGDSPYIWDYSDTLYPYWYPEYPGTYTWELMVFDGCSIGADNVTIVVNCENCVFGIRVPEGGDDITFPSDLSTATVYSSDFGTTWGYSTEMFLEYNSPSWSSSFYNSGGDRYYQLVEHFETIESGRNFSDPNVSPSSLNVVNTNTNPLNMNGELRYEATRNRITTTNSTTITTVEHIFYSSIERDEPRCDFTINNYQGSSSVTLDTDYGFSTNDRIDSELYCLGSYRERLDAVEHYNCKDASDWIDFNVKCGATPRAHLITCARTLNFDYGGAGWPSVDLDAQDSNDPDTPIANLWFRYNIVNKPERSSLGDYVTAGACGSPDSKGAYQNCRTVPFTPDYPGTYTIRLWVGDQCARDSETTTITAVCEAMTAVITGLANYDDSAATDYNIISVNASSSTAANPILGYQWTALSFPGPAPTIISDSSEATNILLHRGGNYQIQLETYDGCSVSTATLNFNWACTKALTPRVTTSSTTTTSPFTAIDIDASTSTVEPGRGSYTWYLTSKPVGSGVAAPGNVVNFQFTPDLPGVYTWVVNVYDGCQSGNASVSVTAGCAALTIPTLSTTATGNTYDLDRPAVASVQVDLAATSTTDNFAWTVTSPTGAAVTLTNAFTLTPSFQATRAGIYRAYMTISNGCTSSQTTVLTITVNCVSDVVPTNTIPQTVTWTNGKFPRTQVDLSFTGINPTYPASSYVPNGQWAFTSAPVNSVFAFIQDSTVVTTVISPPVNGTPVLVSPGVWESTITSVVTHSQVRIQERVYLVNANDAEKFAACFAPDVSGTYQLQWTGTGYCDEPITQTATVTANCNGAPVADAGEDLTISFNENGMSRVVINGKGSSDPNGDHLFVQWDVIDHPANSGFNNTVVGYGIFSPNSLETSFFPDVSGTYVLELRVSDGCTNSTDTVTVTVSCAPGVANLDQPTVNFAFDGFTPITVTHFALTASPRCMYGYDLQFTEFEGIPYNYVPPAAPVEETGAASSLTVSVFALLCALIALLL